MAKYDIKKEDKNKEISIVATIYALLFPAISHQLPLVIATIAIAIPVRTNNAANTQNGINPNARDNTNPIIPPNAAPNPFEYLPPIIMNIMIINAAKANDCDIEVLNPQHAILFFIISTIVESSGNMDDGMHTVLFVSSHAGGVTTGTLVGTGVSSPDGGVITGVIGGFFSER